MFAAEKNKLLGQASVVGVQAKKEMYPTYILLGDSSLFCLLLLITLTKT